MAKKIYLLNNLKYDGVENLEVFGIEYIASEIDINKYDALIFTSKNAIYAIDSFNKDWRDIDSYAIAPKTANVIQKYNGNLVFTGVSSHGDSFASELCPLLKDKKVLYVRASKTVSDLTQILKSDKNAALDAADKRDKYNLIWLKQALVQQDAKAYVFGFQADIYHPSSKPACSESQRSNCDAFKIYRDAISDFAKHTNKPVLVMHGDTGPYCQQQLASNLTRLNVPGDFAVSDVAKVSFIDGQWHIASVTTNVPLTTSCE